MLNCGCKNCEACKCAPVYDISDLRDRIRKLKSQRAEVQSNLATVTEEYNRRQSIYAKLRQDRTILVPDQDLLWKIGSSEAISNDIDPFGNGNDAARYKVWNEKLEMQILTQDTREALQSLEAGVKRLENESSAIAKISLKQQTSSSKGPNNKAGNAINNTTPIACKSSEELQSSLKSAMESLVQSRSSKPRTIEEEKRINQTLSELVTKARQSIARLLRERDSVRLSLVDLQRSGLLHRHQLSYVKREQRQQRDRLGHSYHDGYGWQTEAFLDGTGGDLKGLLKVEQLPSLLAPWLILPTNNINNNSKTKKNKVIDSRGWLSLTFIRQQLSLIAAQEKKERKKGLDEFAFFDNDDEQKGKEEEEELLTVPTIIKPSSVNINADSKEEEQKSSGLESRPMTANFSKHKLAMIVEDISAAAVDLRSFCLLCDRLVILLEDEDEQDDVNA